MDSETARVLHILVIGFHHKKGAQLEFVHPPLEPILERLQLPDPWKHLPSLAMPDGAHNHEKDSVYFHLPGLDESATTVYGVACFQQIPLEEVKTRTEDMTRGTVQKTVCVLATVPLYGFIQTILEKATSLYFQGDFSDRSQLVKTFNELNECLPTSIKDHMYDQLSVTELFNDCGMHTLVLFKLILLEKKVVFFHSSVKPLCTFILSLLSLHPGLIEYGLNQAASASSSSEEALEQDHEDMEVNIEAGKDALEETTSAEEDEEDEDEDEDEDERKEVEEVREKKEGEKSVPESAAFFGSNDELGKKLPEKNKEIEEHSQEKNEEPVLKETAPNTEGDDKDLTSPENTEEEYFTLLGEPDCSDENGDETQKKENTVEDEEKENAATNGNEDGFSSKEDLAKYGLPLKIFRNGYPCLPYVGISYIDFLSSSGIHGFVAGGTNILFELKDEIRDVFVSIDPIEVQSHREHHLLRLSELDEQFIKKLQEEIKDCEEPELIIRQSFKEYMLSMLGASVHHGTSKSETYNQHFMDAWKKTRNYETWKSKIPVKTMDFPEHPGSKPQPSILQATMSAVTSAIDFTVETTKGFLNPGKKLIQRYKPSWLRGNPQKRKSGTANSGDVADVKEV